MVKKTESKSDKYKRIQKKVYRIVRKEYLIFEEDDADMKKRAKKSRDKRRKEVDALTKE